MNIFLIIPTLKQGGAERVMSELANEFSNYPNYQIHLILLAESKDFYPINANVIIHRLDFKSKNILGKLQSELSTFIKLRGLFKKYKPAATLSFMEKYNIFTLLASSFLGLNIYVSDRSNPKQKIPFAIELLRKITYKKATGIIAQTSLSKDILFKKTHNKNIHVIPNPVREVKLFPDTTKEKIIINVGRLVPEKGQKYLLEAFSRLNKTDWKLVILGDGPLRQPLTNQAETLGITNSLIMPGSVKNVDEWLAHSSIFAFSSISEGFPNALIEAMAAGLPCVSFDCDAGPRDIIKDGVNGFLVTSKDIKQLSNKLAELIDNPSKASALALEALNVRATFGKKDLSKDIFNFITTHTS